jgi:acetoacetyl-CoA synthetase
VSGRSDSGGASPGPRSVRDVTGEIIWAPPADVIESSRIGRFVTWLAAERDLDFDGYDALWRWSTSDLDGFWGAVWDYFDVDGRTHPSPALSRDEMPGAEWFPGASLNFAGEIQRRNSERADATAIVAVSQTRGEIEMTFGELFELVARIRVGLLRLGVRPGDRVVSYLPNVPETAAAFLACASIGAVWASCAPEFGAQAVVDRFSQLEPKVLFAVDGYRYGDKDVDIRDRVAAVVAGVTSIEHTIALTYNGRNLAATVGHVVAWEELIAAFEPFEALRVPFDHPLWVLFSSGTTGPPRRSSTVTAAWSSNS